MTSNLNYPNDYIWTKICLCLTKFDFQRVSRFLTLTWHENRTKMPALEDLEKEAEQLLVDAYKWLTRRNMKESYVKSGGFKASFYSYEDGTVDCRLEYIITEADSHVPTSHRLPALSAARRVQPSRPRIWECDEQVNVGGLDAGA